MKTPNVVEIINKSWEVAGLNTGNHERTVYKEVALIALLIYKEEIEQSNTVKDFALGSFKAIELLSEDSDSVKATAKRAIEFITKYY